MASLSAVLEPGAGASVERTASSESPARPGDEASSRAREERKAALIQAHLGSIWAFLRRLGLSPMDAEDAGQEVFLTAVRKIDSIFEGQEKRFLFGVAIRVASRRRRANSSLSRRAVDLDIDTCEATGPTSDEHVERKEALVLLDRALATLNEEMRTVFVLYELEEMTVAEIGAVLDVPVGTVSSRLRRGREQFQKATRQMQTRQP